MAFIAGFITLLAKIGLLLQSGYNGLIPWFGIQPFYPFIAGTFAYLINPTLAQNKVYLISIILIFFWSLTFLGLSGLRASASFASFCAILGMIIPMAVIIILGLIWLLQGQPIAIHLDSSHLMPNWHNSQSWISLTAIMTSFLGMELAAVHVRNVQNPQKNFPRAMYFSVIIILTTMVFGSLAIAFVLPTNQINLVNGVMEAFGKFLEHYHLKEFLPLSLFYC